MSGEARYVGLMSELIIIGYDDHDTAKNAYDTVQALQKELVVELNGIALVYVDPDGKQHVDTPGNLVGTSTAAGALWGALIGWLFLAPGVGLIVGGAIGAFFGGLNRAGVNERFRERVRSMVRPGKAAVVIMAAKIADDKFTAAISVYGGELLQTSLSAEDELELAAGLETGGTAD
jgi:uncharacterized membrane protein